MANTIQYKETDGIHMSNGLTDVFLNVLLLSGSKMAEREEEKRLIVWLAERDQSRVGIGTVGFDLCDMPWDTRTFEADRAFLRKAVSGAKDRLGWESLDYAPQEELLFPCLDRFDRFLEQMDAAQIGPSALREWLAESSPSDPVFCGFPKCPKHHTLLTVFGCQICNN